MKTFNSFFKSANAMTIFANGNVKSIIAIAAVAISSVFGLSSCDKDNEAFDNGPRQQRIEGHYDTFGTGANSTTTTTYIVGKDTTTTTTSNGTAVDTENMVKLTAKDYVGTYKCTADDGKEWVIVLTENATASEGKYSASITVPEGEEVAAKTYDGDYDILRNSVSFCSTETSAQTNNYSIVTVWLKGSKDNSKSFTTTVKLNRYTVKSLVFVKQ